MRSLPIARQAWRSLLPVAATAAVWLLGKTIRIERLGREHEERVLKSGKGFIYAFWHSQLLYFAYSYRGSRVMVLTSRSDDGELISRVIGRLGFETSRGSITGGGGASASVRLLHYMMKSGRPVAICPDGPRGPRCVATKGSIFLAQRAGTVILPTANSFERRKVFKTWDRFVLPYPFTRAVIAYGPPISISEDASEAVTEQKRRELEEALDAVSAQAEAYFDR